MQVPPNVLEAFHVARAAQARAHAPYSNFKVGAALAVAGQPHAVPGCNVENASFGATVCAERTAFQVATAQLGAFTPEALVVVFDGEVGLPCALCLQVIAEFAPDGFPIYVGNRDGITRQMTLADLLPHAFRSFTPAARP